MIDVNKMSRIRYLIFPILILAACSSIQKSNRQNYYLHIIPPNGVKIGENLYYDQTEVTNLDYREFMWWTYRIMGDKSDEYLATIPDTNVWKDFDSCLKTKMRYYLRTSEFEEYPVVGITQKQAEMYSKWRSDRVFEYILIKYGIIKTDPGQKKESCFTIERYFNGTYHNLKPDPDFKYYPEYSLPTTAEWIKALRYADSVEQAYLKKCNSKTGKELKKNWPEFRSDIIPCINDSFKTIPVLIVHSGLVPERRQPLYNLRGNVSEITSENQVSIGGGWANKRQEILANNIFQAKKPNAWTGFRNVCEWKEWNGGKTR